MGKKKIVIDTNNLISALGWEGKSRELIRRVIDKEFELVISIKQMNELKRVMNYPKLKFNENQKNKFLEIISEIATVIETEIELDVVDDPDDNMILECAIESGAEYIISGDDHLKKLKSFKNIKILPVSDFLVEMNNIT